MWKNLKNGAKTLFNEAKECRITTVTGAWVFYFLLAIVPLAFLLITAFNLLGVDVSFYLVARLPEEFKETVETIFKTAKNVSKGITVFFVFTVFFSSFSLINQMLKDGESIYGAKRVKSGGIFKILSAAVFIGLLFFVFLFAAAVFVFGNSLFSSVKISGTGKIYPYLVVFTFIILFCYLVIAMLNRFVSPVKIPLKSVFTGSLVSLFIIVLGTIGFIVYIRITNAYNAFYGSLATVVVFLLWAYILMLGLVSGVVVSRKLYKETEISNGGEKTK